jgi:hypothetical protein
VTPDLMRVVHRRRRTEITVSGWPGSSSPYQVTSSSDVRLPADADWPPALRQALGARAAHGGDDKGRRLFCVQAGGGLVEPIVVGCVLLHVDDRSVLVIECVSVLFKHDPDATTIEVLLLACSQEVARRLGSNCLYRKVYGAANARRARLKFEFKRLPAAHPLQRNNRGAIILERCAKG